MPIHFVGSVTDWSTQTEYNIPVHVGVQVNSISREVETGENATFVHDDIQVAKF